MFHELMVFLHMKTCRLCNVRLNIVILRTESCSWRDAEILLLYATCDMETSLPWLNGRLARRIPGISCPPLAPHRAIEKQQ